MKKTYSFIALTAVLFAINLSLNAQTCPIDSCGNFSNYFINTGPILTDNQDAINKGFAYTIDQNSILGADTTVCYAFIQPANGDWTRLQLFVSYPACPNSKVSYSGYGTNLNSFANGNWSSTISQTTFGGESCIKGSLTGNIDQGSPNEFTTLGTFQYPNCNKIASTLNTGTYSSCSLTAGQTYKHCFKIIKSTTCPGPIAISPVITCNNNCVPAGKKCLPFVVTPVVTNSTCPLNANGSIDLTTCANRKFSYLWNDGITSKNRTGLTPGTYTVTITDTESFSCDTAISLVILPEVCKGVKIVGKTICEGACDTITPVIVGYSQPFTFKWSDGFTGTGVHIVCPNSASTYTVTIADATTTSTATATVTIEVPSVIASADTIICIGDSARLMATGAMTYVWSPSTGLSSTTAFNPLSKPSSAGIYNYTVTGTTALGCVDNDKVRVTVINTIPSADAGPDVIICPSLGETSVTLTANGGNIFLWSTGESTQSIVVNPGQTSTYRVTIHSTCGPGSASDEVTVTVQCEPKIPNVITPNGDLDNQYFAIDNIDAYPNSRIEIFDRWGLKMYETDNYINDWQGGNQLTGKPVPDGVYYYILYLRGKDNAIKPMKGFVQVLKD